MSARDFSLLTKVLAIVAMFEAATLATVAGILAYDIILAGGSPITPTLFGPEVYRTPAMAWVYMQQFAALIAMAGASAIASQSDWWRVGAGMVIAGNLGLSVLMGVLAYYAQFAAEGVVMFAMCLGAGLPWSLAGAGIGAAVFWIERGGK